MRRVSVLLVDDNRRVRAAFRALLELDPKIRVVGEAQDGEEAMRLIEAQRPAVVLADASMPRMDGLELARGLAKKFPNVRVIMLSARCDAREVRAAVEAGAAGYLLKDAAERLETAIKTVAAGKTYFSPAVSNELPATAPESKGKRAALQTLTPRQREILKLIAEGHTTTDIAEQLHISPKTAQTHRMQLMERLGIHRLAGLVRYAIRTGLVQTDS